jgi:hypothetical protein
VIKLTGESGRGESKGLQSGEQRSEIRDQRLTELFVAYLEVHGVVGVGVEAHEAGEGHGLVVALPIQENI